MRPKLPDTATLPIWTMNRENPMRRRFPTTPRRSRVHAPAGECMSSSPSSRLPSWQD